MDANKTQPAAPDARDKRDAEKIMLQKYAANAVAKEITLGDGSKMVVDGYLENPRTFLAAWTRLGEPKSSEPKKLAWDALKLIFAERKLGAGKKVILFADADVRKFFESKSWLAEILAEFGIECAVVELTAVERLAILDAQKRAALATRPKPPAVKPAPKPLARTASKAPGRFVPRSSTKPFSKTPSKFAPKKFGNPSKRPF